MSEARTSLTRRRVSIALFRSEAVILLAVLALATVAPKITGARSRQVKNLPHVEQVFNLLFVQVAVGRQPMALTSPVR